MHPLLSTGEELSIDILFTHMEWNLDELRHHQLHLTYHLTFSLSYFSVFFRANLSTIHYEILLSWNVVIPILNTSNWHVKLKLWFSTFNKEYEYAILNLSACPNKVYRQISLPYLVKCENATCLFLYDHVIHLWNSSKWHIKIKLRFSIIDIKKNICKLVWACMPKHRIWVIFKPN